jgi:alpha-glucosidase
MSGDRWWEDAVIYQIYPRSFCDANGDGIGDLAGITSRLDYLAWLGVDALWLNPITPSPNADWGYDVSDYTGVHPDLGTLEDLDELIAAAGERGLRILLDIVPNHTSIEHPWFRHRPDYYVWSDEIPNNWLRLLGEGPAWTFDAERSRYYMHNFSPGQPDLDWWNPRVRAEFEHILRFWFDRGVAGFRIDVAHGLIKDRELRDDPPATDEDPLEVQRHKLRRIHSMNRPEVHEIYRDWRGLADSYEPPRLLLGEAYVLDPAGLAAFWGQDDELQVIFDFELLHAPLDAAEMGHVVDGIERHLPTADALVAWAGSNHDGGRLATRWAGGHERRARLALLLLLTLRGVPVLYMGDELALEDGLVPPDRITDRDSNPPRDPCRTPMPWSADGAEWVEPWLPFTPTVRNVAGEQRDEMSTLHFVKRLIEARREVRGAYERLPGPAGTWIYRRGERHVVVLNLSDEPHEPLLLGTPLVAVGEPGEPWSGALYLSDTQ